MSHKKKRPRPGATGRFPRGKHRPDDRGELRALLTTDFATATILMDFGAPVTWLAMTADDAERWGRELIRRAVELRENPPPGAN